MPAGNPDKMTIDIIGDPGVALTRIAERHRTTTTSSSRRSDRLAELQAKHADQIKLYTPANTYYYFMNNRVAPFDNVKVRQAVNFAIDREALVRIYGGLATPTENVLPPTYPQYKKLTLYPYNLAKAKQLIKQAGATGADVTVWTSNNDERGDAPQAGAYLQDVLKQIGLNAKLKHDQRRDLLDDGRQPVDEGPDRLRGLVPGLPAPARLVRRPAERQTGSPTTHNNNYSNFDDPAVNAKIEALKKEPTLTKSVNTEWAAGRQDVDGEGRLGAVRERPGHRHLQHRHRPELLRVQRALPVRLRDDLHEVVGPFRSCRGRRKRRPRRVFARRR